MEQLRITVDGKVYEVTVERTDGSATHAATPTASPRPAAAPASAPPASAPPAAPAPAASAQEGDIPSPLAGVVQSVSVKEGDTINAGELILTLEAMKMYTPINAAAAGTIKAIHVKPGDAVEEGQALVSIA